MRLPSTDALIWVAIYGGFGIYALATPNNFPEHLRPYRIGLAVVLVACAILLLVRFPWSPELMVAVNLAFVAWGGWQLTQGGVTLLRLLMIIGPFLVILGFYPSLRQEMRGPPAPAASARENFALYSDKYDTLPPEEMQRLADGVQPEYAETERGWTYTYRWPDLTILVNSMPGEELAEHLAGFVGYVRNRIYGGSVPERGQRVIERIQRTKLVVGVEIQPHRDAAHRADNLVGKLAQRLRPIIFHADALFDWQSKLLLGTDQSFDAAAEIDPS